MSEAQLLASACYRWSVALLALAEDLLTDLERYDDTVSDIAGGEDEAEE